MNKPFVFGTAVNDSHFIGRDKEIKQLENNFRYGVNTILMAPRRMGKTSLVKKVSARVESAEIRIIQMDIFSCRSEYDFLNMFASAIIRQTSSKFEELEQNLRDILSRIVPKFSLSPDPSQEFSMSLGITPRTYKPEEILDIPERIAAKKGCHIIVCIDEFQQVGDFPDSISVQKRMRTVWQHQENVTYCLYGSKKNMMLTLFQQRSKPFYKFGVTMELGVIPTADWVPYLRGRFSDFGKTLPEDVAEEICTRVGLHSSYVQQLAYYTLLCTEGETAAFDTVDEAFENLLDENSSIFVDKSENLTTYQLNFLRAILDGVHKDFGKAEIRETYNLGSPSNIARIREALISKELIETSSEGIFISDPVMAVWLRKRMKWA